MPARGRWIPALALVGAVVLAGCTRPALSRQEYRARVTGYCARAQAAQRVIPAATSRDALLTRLRRLRAVNRRLTNQIARLNLLTPAHPHLPFPHSSQLDGELRELRCHYGRTL